MRLDPGKIYVHVPTPDGEREEASAAKGGRYRVIDLGITLKCPQTGVWHKAVLYEPATEHYGTGARYVRTQKSFCDRFVREEKPTDA